MNINLTTNASKVQKAIQGFSKQMPFAMSQALNSTAFDIRRQIVDRTYPQSFNVKNKRFANAMFRVEKASKRKLSAAVFDRLGKDYMAMQAEGGTKLPRGRNIAIPAGLTNAQQQARYRAHGNRDRLLRVAKLTRQHCVAVSKQSCSHRVEAR